MQYEIWLRRVLGGTSTLALSAALAVAQEPPRQPVPVEPAAEGRARLNVEFDDAQPRDNLIFVAADDAGVSGSLVVSGGKLSEYWIGVECHPIDEAVRTQLGLKDEGLIVEQVMPESPATKAEIKRFDILLSVNDKPLRQVPDLIAVLEESKDKELRFKALRGGKETTIQVTPAKRPEGQPGGEGVRDLIIRHLGPQGADVVKQPLRMQFLHPGLVLPPGGPGRHDLPDDVSITVHKQGKKPATVEVKRGDKTWNTTDDKLAELPDDVRGPVERFLGAGQLFNIKLPEPGDGPRMRVRRLEPPQPPHEGEHAGPQPREGGSEGPRRVERPRVEARIVQRPEGDANARIEQRLQAMAERLSEMNRDLQELRQQRRGGDNGPARDARPRRDRDDQDRRERGNLDRRERGDQDVRNRGEQEHRDHDDHDRRPSENGVNDHERDSRE